MTQAPEDDVLQRWDCYVDEIEGDLVMLVMADLTVDRGDEREIGEFPMAMFKDLEPKLGLLVTVEVSVARGIVITPTPSTGPNAPSIADELVELLRSIRFDEHKDLP